MSIHRIGVWRGRGGHRQVFIYRDEDKNRMGHCRWLPQDGDLCVRTEDAGDCFHKYVAIRQKEDNRFVKVGDFGAYVFGKPLFTLDERTFHLVCAGEPVALMGVSE